MGSKVFLMGGSNGGTGGVLVGLAHHNLLKGALVKVNMAAWKSFKLPRVSIGSGGAEGRS